ncbi:MAG: hypothetical protein EOP07_03490 [Proteobacteria bacterium]|nr:MAG: hypothetical protein EOP07_03490 [Pseudomonadota bacterium]
MMRISMAFAALIFTTSLAHAEGFDPENSENAATHAVQRSNQGDGQITLEFYNHCPFPIRVGQMGAGDFAYLNPYEGTERWIGGDDAPHLALAYYGYKHDSHPGFGNMSLAEFSFNTSFQWLDFYNISLVDGFNLPIDISAVGAACEPASCNADLLPGCPDSQRIWQNGWTIACSKFGDRDTPWNPAAQHFANACPGAYSWSKDDSKVRGCNAQDYRVTFCK